MQQLHPTRATRGDLGVAGQLMHESQGRPVSGSAGAQQPLGHLDESLAQRRPKFLRLIGPLADLEQDRLARVATFMQEEFGYIAIQSTRPGLIGVALADSPVGQLAWILDKLRAWTHPLDADPVDVLGLDFVLGNASLYWFTASAGSAAYVGYTQDGDWGSPPPNSGVPTATIQFAHDIGVRRVAEESNTILSWTDVPDRGGHFAALEEPTLLLDDVRAFLRPLR